MRKNTFLVKVIMLLCIAQFVMAGGSQEAEGPLLVYSPQSETDLTYILDAANAALPFDVEILNVPGGELADRLIAERQNPQADVVFGLVPLSIVQLKQEGILEAYAPPWTEGLPLAYQDEEHYFHSFWQTPIVLAYNSDVLSAADAPRSWLDLANPEYEGKFVVGETAWQTTRTFLVGILWNFYDQNSGTIAPEGWELLRRFYANSLPFQDGPTYWSDISEGKTPLILSWFGGVKRDAAANNLNITYINTSGGTPIIAEAIALIKKEDEGKKERSQAFIDWFGSSEFQIALANDLGKAPAHPDALALAPAETRQDMAQFTAQDIDWTIAGAKLSEWLEKIELEIIP